VRSGEELLVPTQGDVPRHVGVEPLAGDEQPEQRHPDGHSHDHRFSSYCARGRYLEQLRLWERHFPRDQLLVIISERLFAEPAAELLRVSRFLGLGSPSSDAFPPRNVGHYGELSPGTRERLADYFRQPNQELADYLGSDPGWDG